MKRSSIKRRRPSQNLLPELLESRQLFSTVTVTTESVNESAGVATFTASLNAASTKDVTIYYATSNGTAIAGKNYVRTNSSVTIAAGQTSSTFTIPVLDDDTYDANKTFFVSLRASAGNTLTSRRVVETVFNTDPIPTVTTSDVDVVEATTKNTGVFATVTVNLSDASSTPVLVDYSTSDGTAVAGTDYKSTRGVLRIAAGKTSGTIRVRVLDDPDSTGDETFDVNLTSAIHATLASDVFSKVTILNSTTAAEPSVSISSGTVDAPTSGTTTIAFDVTLSSESSTPVTVDYQTTDGTAVSGTDYTAASGTLTFAAGVTSQTVYVTVAGSASYSGSKTFEVVLTDPAGAILSQALATGTINYSGSSTTTSTPSVSVASASVTAPTSGTTTIPFVVTLSSASSSTVTVHYTTADGTATAGTNYTATSGTLTFAAGTTSQTIDVTVDGSSTLSGTETFTLTLSDPSGATLTAASATGTITYVGSTTTSTTDLSDNLSSTTDSEETADATDWLTASFTTGSSAVTLKSVTLLLSADAASDVGTVYIYSDGGLQPAAVVGTLTSPASYSTTLAQTTFTGSVSLSANTTYWVVLVPTTGTFSWAYTDDNTGTGTGFTGVWGQTSDSGTTWFSDDVYPLQMSVSVV